MLKRRFGLAVVGALVVPLMLCTALPVFAGGQASNNTAGAGPTTDGQIVFRRYLNAAQTKGALFLMNPDGSHIGQLTDPPEGWRDNVPAWSPDGATITFERFKSDDSTSRVMVVDPDTGDTHAVVPCTADGCAYAIDPYFSPDNLSIAYARTVVPRRTPDPPEWKLYSAIFIVGLDGSDSHQVSSTPERHRGQPPAFETSDPTFSPNGELLAFVRTRFRPEEHTAVFVQPIGSPDEAQRITPWKMNCQDRPTFSPDGTLVLFRCQPRGEEGPSNLYWAHPDGTEWQQITHAPAAKQYLGSSFAPTFNAGEGWMAVGRTAGIGKAGNADVFRILIEDGLVAGRVNLTESEEWDSAPGWGTHPPTWPS